MRDIYHLISGTDFRSMSDSDLIMAADQYDSAAIGITSALSLIGNLIFEADCSEEYSGDEAKRDLALAGSALRNLPRLQQALLSNADHARTEQSNRESKGARK